jgi:hypothetical protein
MANIINNNFNFYKLKPYRGEYWDFFLNKDMKQGSQSNFISAFDTNLISYFDLSNLSSFDGIFVNTSDEYKWDGAYSTDYILDNIGYTGFDNGLLYFEKDKIRNEEFPILYRESTYEIKKDEEKLKLHFVTGSTIQYSYEYEIEDESVKLNGGFLQGFFKTECGKYEVLPSSFKHGDNISLEFTLKPVDLEQQRFPRLNDVHPNNKGMFFYIGTRAENKWIYMYDKDGDNNLAYDDYIEGGEINIDKYKLDCFLDMDMPSNEELFPSTNITPKNSRGIGVTDDNVMSGYIDFGEDDEVFGDFTTDKCELYDFFGDDYLDSGIQCECDFNYLESELDISDFVYQTSDKLFTLGLYEDYVDYNNPFLLFNRTCDGFHVGTWENDSYIRYMGVRTKAKNEGNLFILMDRTSTGYTTSTIDAFYKREDEKYDIYADLYENALSFRITDDGEIGYRYLTKNCEKPNKMEIIEAYSKKNIVKKDEWNHIVVRIIFIYDTMIFKFYVNGNLVFISRYLPKLNLRALDELYEKQETVPFNISLGGGTQGLCDTILPNYMINPYRIYPLEENFAGSFIGYIKTFKIYLGDMNYNEIFNNFQYEVGKILK